MNYTDKLLNGSDPEEGQTSPSSDCHDDVIISDSNSKRFRFEDDQEKKFDLDSDSDSSSTAVACLPVVDFSSTFTPESIPTDGTEYLALVKHQREFFLPQVKANPDYIPRPLELEQVLRTTFGQHATSDDASTLNISELQRSEIEAIIEEYLGARELESSQDLKAKVIDTSSRTMDRHSWFNKLYNKTEMINKDLTSSIITTLRPCPGELCMRLLNYHTYHWLPAKITENESVFSKLMPQVIYFLLTKVEDYGLTALQQDSFRRLARELIRKHNHCDDIPGKRASPSCKDKLVQCILILAHHFGQRDLLSFSSVVD